ncbi:MAG: MraY family glycosyltransferase [Methylococcaceae bacterium]
MPLITSAILTGVLRRYAIAASLMDIPNVRSSHHLPTPRGGGLAIVIVVLAGLPVLSKLGLLAQQTMWAILGAGAWIAWVGFLDDQGHIPARWRLLAHFIAVAWVLFWLGGLPVLVFGSYSIDMGWVGYIIGAFYLVWILNLYNFMDGIDGLAGIEAITVCFGGMLLFLMHVETSAQYWQLVLLAMAVLGFLLWNFPRARIFMGDAGSGFLGIIMGIFSLQAAWAVPQFFWSWLILLGVFIVDATWTLLRRCWQGEKIYEAHRSHAYQYASRYYGAHKPITLAVGAINICWLTPVALWVGLGSLNGLLGLCLAYLPLVLLAVHFKAGVKEIA